MNPGKGSFAHLQKKVKLFNSFHSFPRLPNSEKIAAFVFENMGFMTVCYLE